MPNVQEEEVKTEMHLEDVTHEDTPLIGLSSSCSYSSPQHSSFDSNGSDDYYTYTDDDDDDDDGEADHCGADSTFSTPCIETDGFTPHTSATENASLSSDREPLMHPLSATVTASDKENTTPPRDESDEAPRGSSRALSEAATFDGDHHQHCRSRGLQERISRAYGSTVDNGKAGRSGKKAEVTPLPSDFRARASYHTFSGWFVGKDRSVVVPQLEEEHEFLPKDASVVSGGHHLHEFHRGRQADEDMDFSRPESERNGKSRGRRKKTKKIKKFVSSASSFPSPLPLFSPNTETTASTESSPMYLHPAYSLPAPPPSLSSCNSSPCPDVAQQRQLRQQRRIRRKRKAAEAREKKVMKVRGTAQSGCRDALFAILFVAQLVAISIAAITYGPGALNTDADASANGTATDVMPSIDEFNPFAELQNGDDIIIADAGGTETEAPSFFTTVTVHIDYINFIQLSCITSMYASLLSLLTIGFMMILGKSLLHASLLLTVVLSLAWTIFGMAISPYSFVPILGVITLALSLGYAVVVWDRLPFAATNLQTALCAVRCTVDITLLGFTMLIIALIWTVWWLLAFIGVYDYINDGEVPQWEHDGGTLLFLAFFVSYYWTFSVIKGVVQVTVAGVVGTWWSSPDDITPCCSRAVHLAFARAVSHSLGSICFGCLLLKPMQSVNKVVSLFCPPRSKHPDRTRAIATSLSSSVRSRKLYQGDAPIDRGSCTTAGGAKSFFQQYAQLCSDKLTQHFNQWCFSYIGLYGYSFLDAGKNATILFKTREWTEIVSDDLIHNVLFMASLVIGGSTGCFGLLVEEVDGYSFTSFGKPIITAFMVGSFIGFTLSNVILSTVVSAVNTVLVCYAAMPFEFQENHSQLSQDMKKSWSKTWSRMLVQY